MPAPMRKAAFWDVEIEWERRVDGSILIRQKGPLGNYPVRLSDRIAHWAATAPDRVWMAERGADGSWQKTTHGQMFAAIRAIGQALLDLNLSVERPLVILSGNSVAHGLMALGAQYVGIPSAAIAPAYALVASGFEKLKSVRDQITPGAVYVEDTNAFLPAIREVFPDLPLIARTGEGASLGFAEIVTTPVTDAVETANAATGPDTVAKFLFTSGTTGSPKAVIQTQRMLCANMEMMTDCYAYLRDEPPVILDWAPWNHVAAGNLIFNTAIYNGGTFYIDEGRPVPALIGKTIENLREIRTNWYWNVPVGFEMLMSEMRDDPDFARTFFADMKIMYYAGAAMAQHTWDALKAAAIDTTGEEILLATGLGATETAPFCLFMTDPQPSPGNVGVPGKGLTLKLVPNDGKWEARVKGPSVTPGYWRNDKLTREAFDEEGFYCLGDALRFADENDPSKGFYFDGRVAENFKMSTGTWVAVGALRAKLIDALGGLARDCVIAGDGRDSLAALLVPVRTELEKLVPGAATLSDAELVAHPAVRAKTAELLAHYNRTAGGSSLRVPHAMYLTDPLDLDKGEVTDKGSVNQRAVLRHRGDLVEALYGGDARVI
jgi:feruloyl-CoA synthase